MTERHKLDAFFAAERHSLAELPEPAALERRIKQLAADYYAVEQKQLNATLASPPTLAAVKPLRLRKQRRERGWLAALAAAALIICAIGFGLPSGDNLLPGIGLLVEIKPAYAASGGMDTRAGFVISASQPLSSELVEQALHIHPAFDYRLEEEGTSAYRVVPNEPLQADTVYNISFDPERERENKPQRAEYSWSFQTEPAFALTEISPEAEARNVVAEASLVLSFNKELSEQAAGQILLEPAVAGSWQVLGASLIFTPETGWDYDCAYTVRVAAGLAARDGSLLAQGISLRFRTEAAPPPPGSDFNFNLAQDYSQGLVFSPADQPNWQVRATAEDQEPYLARIFALAGPEAYAAAVAADGPAQLELEQLSEYAAYELWPQTTEDGLSDLALPEALPGGFYLAETVKNEISRYLLFQVSGIQAYALWNQTERLLWLHDASGAPLAQARVSSWPGDSAQAEQGLTDESGLIILRGEQEACAPLIYCVSSGDDALVLAEAAPQSSEPPLDALYRYYLYCEQSYYSPGQALRFFGFCEAVPGPAAELPEHKLSLRLSGVETPAAALPYAVEVTNGAFSGELLLPGLSDGTYELALYAGEEYVGGRMIEVGPPAKAACRLSISPVNAVALAGESVTWLVEAELAGQPLAGLPLLVADQAGHVNLSATTDANGQAELIIPAPRQDGQPYSSYVVHVSADLPGLGQVSVGQALTVLQYQAFIESELIALDEQQYLLQLSAYGLSLPKEFAGESDTLEQALRQPFSGEMNVSATLLLQPEDEEAAPLVAQEFELVVNDDEPWQQQLLLPQPGQYTLLLAANDPAGRAFELTLSLPPAAAAVAEAPLLLQDAYTAAQDTEHLYAPGEQISLTLYQGQEPLSLAADAQCLFVLAGPQPLQASAPTAAGSASFSAAEASSGLLYGWAVYYQQGGYQAIGPLALNMESPATAVLTILDEVSAAAGLPPSLNLQLTGAAGEPLAGTLNLQVLAGPPAQLPLPSVELPGPQENYLYRQLISCGQTQAAQTLTLSQREDFRPTDATAEPKSLLFITLDTDGQGLVSLDLCGEDLAARLPGNNLTLLWQAYAPEQGLTASGLLNLDLRAPLAIESRWAGPYQEGDQPILLLKAAGAAVAAGEQVDYQISLPQMDFKASFSAPCGEWQELALPVLVTGAHQLLLTAQSGEWQAQQALDFTVLTRHEEQLAYQLVQQPAAEGLPSLDPAQQDLTVLFCDSGRAADIAALYALAQQDTVELGQTLAARAAQAQLAQLGLAKQPQQEIGLALALYQQADGGLAPLPGGDSQMLLSALAAPLLPENNAQINRAALAAYLFRCYAQAQEQTEQAQALAGLAALNQPVLLAIERLLADEPTAETRLYLALAYLGAGNGCAAKALTLELLPEQTISGADGLTLAQGFAEDDPAEQARATAYLALLANVFELPQAGALNAALAGAAGQGHTQPLAQARILQARGRRLPQAGYLSYTLEGQTHYVAMQDQACYSLNISAKEASGFSVAEASPGLALNVLAAREAAAPQLRHAPRLERSYQQQTERIALRQNQLIEVELEFYLPAQTPPGWYQLTDTLPAGVSFYAFDTASARPGNWLLSAEQGQVSFSVYKGAGAYQGRITYTALSALPGQYSAPPPLLRAVRQPLLAAYGQTQQLEIK